MRIRLADLWRWQGTIDRGPYLLIGVLGFAIKHNLDRLVATLVFDRRWDIFNYWLPPTEAARRGPRSRCALTPPLAQPKISLCSPPPNYATGCAFASKASSTG